MDEPPVTVDDSCLTGEPSTRAEKVSEVVARRIVRDIAAHHYAAGDTLPPEAEMSAAYGVGRGSLREALRILEVQGLITIKSGPGGGPILAGMSASRLGATAALHLQVGGATRRAVAQARLVLEPVFAHQAALNASSGEIRRMHALIAAAETDNKERALRLASAFHSAVVRASGNAVLALLGDTLREIWTSRLRDQIFSIEDAAEVRAEHRGIAEAIESGRPEVAEQRMREHVTNFLDVAMRLYPGALGEVVEWH
jgi:DNA-binding FadR family transcriptional regulator